jgi:hypothetical protein
MYAFGGDPMSEKKTEQPCCAESEKKTYVEVGSEAEACCGETKKLVDPGRCC